MEKNINHQSHSYSMTKEWHELGQHELLKPQIFLPHIKKEDKIIEVGAGRGRITQKLADNSSKVLAFEIDKSYEQDLAKITNENTTIVLGDALEYDWSGFNKIISNLPFHLTEPVIKKAIARDINELVLLIGEKSRYKLLSDNDFGWIIRKHYDVEVLEELPAKNYNPEPNTTTWLVTLQKKSKMTTEERAIISIYVSTGKIKNAIAKSLFNDGLTKNQARERITSIDIDSEYLDKPCNKATVKMLKIIEVKLHEALTFVP